MSEQIQILAHVGPGSLNNAKYALNIAGWEVVDHTMCLSIAKQVHKKFNEPLLNQALRDLENLILAIFISDHIPRSIFYFDYPQDLEMPDQMFFQQVLGNPPNPIVDSVEKTIIQSFTQSGWIFNFKPGDVQDMVPANQTVEEWFNLLSQKPHLASSLSLLQYSFRSINLLFASYRYGDYLQLTNAILAMISGLESIFFHASDDHADITFKFQIVGTAYYTKFASEEFLGRFSSEGRKIKKLSFAEFKFLLKQLYGMRSKIAHGSIRELLYGKDSARNWNKFFEGLNVGKFDTGSVAHLRGHVLLALGLLQKHILALISCAKQELAKGPSILDELLTPR
jgi:hypothetical protein